jgi:hypothetical protein
MAAAAGDALQLMEEGCCTCGGATERGGARRGKMVGGREGESRASRRFLVSDFACSLTRRIFFFFFFFSYSHEAYLDYGGVHF